MRYVNRGNWLWGVLFVLLLIGLGVLVFFRKKDKTNLDRQIQVSESEKVVIDVEGNEHVQDKQETFEVVNWDSGNAELKVKDDQNNQKTIKINPESMKLLVPVVGRGKKGQFIAVTNNKGIDWEWAFCQGDEVNISTDESGSVIMIMNIGYRMCSFGRE